MPLPTAPTTINPDPSRLRGVIYGAPGAGKTTLASSWYPKSNLLLDCEGGTRFLDGEHYREDIKVYSDFAMKVHELETQPHNFTTVTIDTIDTLVRLADAGAGQRHGKVAAGLVEYGKGLADRDGTLLRDLGRLLALNIGVILVAHPTTIEVENGDDYLSPRVDKDDERLRQPILGMVDFVLAVHRDPITDARTLVTGGDAGYVTKRRTGVPDRLECDAKVLYEALKASLDKG